jgi:hypothetical protein
MDELEKLAMWEELIVDDELHIQKVPHGYLYKLLKFNNNVYEVASVVLVKEDND